MSDITEKLTLFRRVLIFDGENEQVTAPQDVLVRYRREDGREQGFVERITNEIDEVELDIGDTELQVLDGGGTRVLMPGLIDAHWHAMFAAISAEVAMTQDPGYLHAIATKQAERTLMRGFTTVRDMQGPSFGLKQAIDEGIVTGPRIYPSGAALSQSSGHGDFRGRNEVPRDGACPLAHGERLGGTTIADGVTEVLRGAREQLMLGASQIKVMAGGGVSSSYDPLDVTEYTEAEIHAAVEAAENWGTYVTVHAYTPRAIQQAIRAGVKCIEHGQLTDEETASLIAAKGIWWCLQPFLGDEDAIPQPDPIRRAKQKELSNGTINAYELAIKHGALIAWGTDVLFSASLAERQGAMLAKMTTPKKTSDGREIRWFTPYEALRIATSRNAELLKMSGPRDPYPGDLGVVKENALADLLLIKGNPLENIDLLTTPDASLLAIMKNGVLVKNILPPG